MEHQTQIESNQSLDLEKELKNRLNRYFKARIDERFSAPKNIIDSIEYSLLAPGKRIRPRLAIESAKLFDLSHSAALAVGLSIEMIHCFSLIHDDLPCMDDDDFRRGKPSNHKVYGEALSLLAGDALMPMAIEVFTEASLTTKPGCFVRGLQRFMETIGPRGVMGGQAEEMLLTKTSTHSDLRSMHLKKTGALFEASILIPAELSGWDSKSEKGVAIQSFATSVGLGFQVADDFEDQEQDEQYEEPRSILNFMSKKEASETTIENLSQANDKMLNAFGKNAETIININHEIIKRLKL